ncbi:MAG: MoaD/ThiS family protein [Mycolicibacterium neoaurum]|uniref:MoaD/ThiS family protein n=1 Tax=Mycolicibacterium neoaurum TaxID=1795 RepID=UPI002FF566A8
MDDIQIVVRYFAAARAAAGTETETLRLPTGTTVLDVVGELAERGPELAKVLARCSYLVDGLAVRDKSVPLSTSETLDVLPPFAGG